MFNPSRVITVLCLAILAVSLIAPAAAPLILCLSVVGFVVAALLQQRFDHSRESDFRPLDPALFFISLRAPPQL